MGGPAIPYYGFPLPLPVRSEDPAAEIQRLIEARRRRETDEAARHAEMIQREAARHAEMIQRENQSRAKQDYDAVAAGILEDLRSGRISESDAMEGLQDARLHLPPPIPNRPDGPPEMPPPIGTHDPSNPWSPQNLVDRSQGIRPDLPAPDDPVTAAIKATAGALGRDPIPLERPAGTVPNSPLLSNIRQEAQPTPGYIRAWDPKTGQEYSTSGRGSVSVANEPYNAGPVGFEVGPNGQFMERPSVLTAAQRSNPSGRESGLWDIPQPYALAFNAQMPGSESYLFSAGPGSVADIDSRTQAIQKQAEPELARLEVEKAMQEAQAALAQSRMFGEDPLAKERLQSQTQLDVAGLGMQGEQAKAAQAERGRLDPGRAQQMLQSEAAAYQEQIKKESENPNLSEDEKARRLALIRQFFLIRTAPMFKAIGLEQKDYLGEDF